MRYPVTVFVLDVYSCNIANLAQDRVTVMMSQLVCQGLELDIFSPVEITHIYKCGHLRYNYDKVSL